MRSTPEPLFEKSMTSIHDIGQAGALDIYARDVGRYPLLTDQEEIQLGRAMTQATRHLINVLLEDEERILAFETLILEVLAQPASKSDAIKSLQGNRMRRFRNVFVTLVDTLKVLHYLGEQPGTTETNLRANLGFLLMGIGLNRTHLLRLARQGSVMGHPLASPVQEALAHYLALRNRLVQHNLRLVFSVIGNKRITGVTFEEQIQSGNIGLIKAADRFNFSSGFRFSTYAYWCIQSTMKYAAQKTRYTIARPTYLQDYLGQVIEAKQQIQQSTGRPVTPEAISRACDLPIGMVEKILALPGEPLPMDKPLTSDTETTWEAILPAPKTGRTDARERHHQNKYLDKLLATLPAREQLILKMRYGIGYHTEHSLEEVSRQLGVSLERVRQLQHEAVRKLGHTCAEHPQERL